MLHLLYSFTLCCTLVCLPSLLSLGVSRVLARSLARAALARASPGASTAPSTALLRLHIVRCCKALGIVPLQQPRRLTQVSVLLVHGVALVVDRLAAVTTLLAEEILIEILTNLILTSSASSHRIQNIC